VFVLVLILPCGFTTLARLKIQYSRYGGGRGGVLESTPKWSGLFDVFWLVRYLSKFLEKKSPILIFLGILENGNKIKI
jgi:hypothetical protein